ncbi:hypothetical protein [Sorangium sp. So ce1182]|uniref:hypothetical protein n=1 Tax=Sorangium sp. So ce1182 TaxID=3133334 RepID=UPI003F5E7B87
MDRTTRRKYYNLCNPEEALAPSDARCVDVDALAGGARGVRWAATLAQGIELAERPVCELFTGLPGAGVTTELLRLAARLRDEQGANLLVVHIDAHEVLDLSRPIETPEVLLAVLQRTEEAVAAASGAPSKERLRRLRMWLAPAAPEGGWASDERPAESLRASPDARARFRARVDPELSRFVDQVRDELVLLNEQARRDGRSGVVVLLDGLEKLRGMSTNRREVLDSAERVLVRGAPVTTLPVHVVLTTPPGLVLRLDRPVRFLPMIAVADRDGRRNEQGYAATLEIIRRRVPDEVLDDIFGAKARAEHIEQMIHASAGCPRDLVRLLRDCIAAQPLREAEFRRMLAEVGEAQLSLVPETAIPLLSRIRRTKALAPAGPDERELLERLLSDGVLLRYQQDGDPWVDVLPAVRRLPGVSPAR